MKSTSNTAFSLVLALWLTLILSLTGLYLLEYVVPFSRNVKGIESASSSFYQAYSWLEEALLLHSTNGIWYQSGTQLSTNPVTFKYTIVWNGRFSPRQGVGEGSSEYDTDYNKLSQSEPAQFLIGNGRLNGGSSNLRLSIKVPDIHPSTTDALSNTGNIVLWQLSSTGQSLTAASLINATQINATFTGQFLNTSRSGTLLNGVPSDFQTFYNQYCDDPNEECVFKVSLISSMTSTLSWNPRIPYLEYQLRTDPDIPLRESSLEVQGRSYGFSKTLRVLVPQLSTNSAFDFTVFQ